MSHQKSIVHHFFPLIVQQDLEKIVQGKVAPLGKTNTKLLENINFGHIKFKRVVKSHFYIIFSSNFATRPRTKTT